MAQGTQDVDSLGCLTDVLPVFGTTYLNRKTGHQRAQPDCGLFAVEYAIAVREAIGRGLRDLGDCCEIETMNSGS